MGNILIRDAVVVPMCGAENKKYFRGSIGIEGNLIAFVDGGDECAEEFRKRHAGDLQEIDGWGFAVIPGLVNTHCHTPMTLMRSYADDLPLMPWLREYIWPFEARMTDDDFRLGTELGIAEMLLGGTTCFLDMYFKENILADVVEKAGMRAVLSTTLLGDNRDDFEKDFYGLTERYASGKPDANGRITLMVGAHSPYTLSREMLLYAGETADKYGVGLHIHVAETLDETGIIREKTGLTPVRYLDELGLLRPSTLAAHCVHLTDEDIRILAGKKVSVSHNPQSNMKLASGISPVAKMLSENINVAIGTDGASSNNDLDMWEEMRSASFLQKVAEKNTCVLPAWEVLKMATVNGAKALGLEGRAGQLKGGMLADLVMVDMRKPHLHPQTDIIANLVYCAKSGDVDTVITDGRIMVEHGELKGWDLPALYDRVDRRVSEMKAGR